MREVEILAPAGSIESLYGALKLGADAVYTGTSRFGARAFADNPSVEELVSALTYAHLRGKKIYLTVNTLLTDRELEEELFPLIRPLYEAGLDACIVQDMGVLAFLHENFPDMALHASTQMTILSGEEANLLIPYGVTRFVPARELTLEEIRRAREKSELEIEVFVHGALCYCYSGQCLMSEVVGGRSGNRGMCAQPCRLCYETERGRGHFLSTKDICTLLDIPDLVDAGIDSFKIEGRMKRREYSAYMAYLYRKYVNLYRERGREYYRELREDRGSELWRDFRDSADLYNRGGFSRGFLFEKEKADMVYPGKNGHFGTLAGHVEEEQKSSSSGRRDFPSGKQGGPSGKKGSLAGQRVHRAVFTAAEDLHPGDVLEFREKDDTPAYEYTVGKAVRAGSVTETNVLPGSHIFPGQKVYRRKNEALLREIEERIQAAEDKYPVRGEFEAAAGRPVRFTLRDDRARVTVEGEMVSPAENRPVTEAQIRDRLDSLGNTDYCFSSLEVRVEGGVFVPLGQIKKLRREAFSQWEFLAAPGRRAPERAARHEFTQAEKKQAVSMIGVSTMEQLTAACECADSSVLFCLKLEDLPPREWPAAAEALTGRRMALVFPRILRGKAREFFDRAWAGYGSVFSTRRPEAVVVNSLSAYLAVKELFPQTSCYGGYNLYRENRRAGEVWESFGLLPVPPLAYGRIPVMVTESCLARTIHACQNEARRGSGGGDDAENGENPGKIEIKGPKGDEFVAVAHCGYCVNTIYTKYPVSVGGQRPVGAQRTDSTSCTNSMSRTDRAQRSIGSQRTMDAQCSAGGCQIDFTWENAEEVREVIRKWNL